MASFAQFGNDLYTGKRSFDFVGRRKVWYLVAAVMILIAIVGPLLRGGFVFGIEFTGGSQFTVSDARSQDQGPAADAVATVVPTAVPKVSTVSNTGIRVQTDQLTDTESRDVRAALAEAYGVPAAKVTSSFIGPSWGADITSQALKALVIFLFLAAIVMALYFRTWKMSVAALVALCMTSSSRPGSTASPGSRSRLLRSSGSSRFSATRCMTPSWCLTRSERIPARMGPNPSGPLATR